MTAEEFLEQWINDMDKPFKETMIEFAKYHVEQALKQASIKVSAKDIQGSIRNAYSLENIK